METWREKIEKLLDGYEQSRKEIITRGSFKNWNRWRKIKYLMEEAKKQK